MTRSLIAMYALSALYFIYATQYAVGYVVNTLKKKAVVFNNYSPRIRMLWSMSTYFGLLVAFPLHLAFKFKRTKYLIDYGNGYITGFVFGKKRRP